MPHYNNSTWTFARGATATIDRDLGFIDTHLFHDIIGTHVCHHLVSTIPFYHAGEASIYIRKVMGKHYRADTKTGFWAAFWKSQRTCKFVEETEGAEGSGVFMFRNLYNREGETKCKNLVGDIKASAVTTSMPSSRAEEARRRLSHSAQSAQLRAATLPLLAE